MKKQTGIWLDSKEANFIELENGNLFRFKKIDAGITSGKSKGGAWGGGRQGGTAVGASEKSVVNRLHEQERKYFDEILDNLQGAGEVVIFGPGETKDHLVNTIKAQHSHFAAHLKGVRTADKMTDHQKIAYVKTFFAEN